MPLNDLEGRSLLPLETLKPVLMTATVDICSQQLGRVEEIV